MSGASGAVLGIKLLEAITHFPEWESHLVISSGARRTIREETSYTVAEVESLATEIYPIEDIGASISSGTFKTAGMVIIPCAMKTVAGVRAGYSENLILRAADVVIKERRPLVVVAREAPLSPIHLENLLHLARLGTIVIPPVLTYYNHPETIEDMSNHVVGKVLEVFGLEFARYKRWKE